MEHYHDENSNRLNHQKAKAQPFDQLLHKTAQCLRRQGVLGLYVD